MNVYIIGMIISFTIYILISLIIGRKVKTASDFYVAGRRAPILLIVGSMIASYISTNVFMADAGDYYSGLFSPLTILVTIEVAGYIYGAVFFGRFLRRSEVYTIPEFFGKRFNSERIRVLATITSMTTMFVYLISVLQGLGTLMNYVTGIEYNTCVILSMIVFLTIVMVSGSSGVLITDTIMFGLFTSALIVGSIMIISRSGGWGTVITKLVDFPAKSGLLTWGGNTDYLYADRSMNILWGIVYGIVWLSVCMVGPWQSSRYLMAKNEHTVIRSSLFSAFGIFMLQLIIGMTAVSVNIFNPDITPVTNVMIWAATNILPTMIGVIMLTGVLAAGISSVTTFLSLIGSSIANDIFKSKTRSILIGRVSMLFVSIIAVLITISKPPQIRIVLYLGGTIVAASWMPVCIASILSKRVTKTGAFLGMLVGFSSVFLMKLYAGVKGISLPMYLDPTVVGILSNTICLILGSLFTKVTPEEVSAREMILKKPDSEKDRRERHITIRYAKAMIVLGVVISAILLIFWAIPVLKVGA